MNKVTPLQKLARSHGIQTSFVNNSGQEQFASEETLRVLLDRLGVDQDKETSTRPDPVIVSWQKGKGPLKFISGKRPRKIELKISDVSKPIPVRNFRVREIGDGRFELALPVSDLPTGYHRLAFSTKTGEETSLLISAPRKIYAESHRQWGAFLPMYAAHSKNSWGAGNLTDWKQLSEWVASLGGKVVGTLPLMAAVLDYPKCEPSPYSPSSRLFWNEFFIDVTAIPEFSASSAAQRRFNSAPFQRALAAFRSSDLIDYRKQWEARQNILEILAREFFATDSPRRTAFERYLKARPEVDRYARFRAACDKSRTPWQTWAKTLNYVPETHQFYLYIQWIAQEQIDHVLSACRATDVKFYLDLPLGVNPDGFDAWNYRDFFARSVSAGAPPDAFFTKGQDWGFAPLDPRRTRDLHYRYLIDYLRFQMRHTGLLRIDHVMGLHRLWWVPHGYPASAGAYIRYPADELYAILSVESHLHKTTLVGENLGTVPPEVNKRMDRHGLRRMYVVQYEQPSKGPLRTPDAQVVASINTHDMPMFAAHWKGLDILDRADLGLIQDLLKEKRDRDQLRQNLVSFLRKKKLVEKSNPKTRDVLAAILKFLAQSPAETVLINLEDLWAEERSQNVPGTSSERPNWQRKAAMTVEQLASDKALASLLRNVSRPG